MVENNNTIDGCCNKNIYIHYRKVYILKKYIYLRS